MSAMVLTPPEAIMGMSSDSAIRRIASMFAPCIIPSREISV